MNLVKAGWNPMDQSMGKYNVNSIAYLSHSHSMDHLDLGLPEDMMHDFAFDIPDLGRRDGSVAAGTVSQL